ncbi:hypothetical protein [Aeoliella sp.]|uniref:hypothetical protein n=1 Tax=Aeoliella sp. TaxID=2795800 RepID=UPI003CCB770B
MLPARHFIARAMPGRLFFSLALVATVVAAPHAVAQFDALKVGNPAMSLTRARSYAKRPTGDAEQKANFEKFIKAYYLPLMTQNDAASLSNLAKLRSDFVRSFLRSADATVAADVTNWTMAGMPQIVKGSYHPAVRYNAMLLIGDLDAQYGSRTADAKPLPQANEYLAKYVSGGINTPKAPAPLIVGALVGLERHAGSLAGLPAANQTATATALLAVLEKEDFPHDIQPSVAQWLNVMAARGLGKIGALGDGNKVHLAMMKAIGNEEARLNTRVRIAEQLEGFKPAYESATGIDEKQTVETLLQLATDIAANEKERAVEYEEEIVGPGGGISGGYRGDFGGGYGGAGDTELPSEYQVRRILLRLSGLKKGIDAVKPALKDARYVGMLDAVVEAADPVIDEASDRNTGELQLTEHVKQMASKIAETTAALGVEAVEAPPESDEEAAEELMEGNAPPAETAAAAAP